MSDHTSKKIRVASIIASQTAGGIGPVCRYAAEGIAKRTGWDVTLLSLHDPVADFIDEASGLRIVGLGLEGNCACLFLRWLAENPQDVIITSDVSRIEPAFCFLPPITRHLMQIHDSGRRYRDVAVRHAAWVDGVTCVGQHIESSLRKSLDQVGFNGILRAVHNGANFPPPIQRQPHDGPLRLLFMGRVEAFKGVFDCVPLLQKLEQLGVPATLNIVGGKNEALRRQFQRKGLEKKVIWTGRVSHAECYEIAAASDIFLMASRKEPFGMVTIEAMSMGCVPIAYDIPSGSTEIIEHGKSGLLVPLGDIRAWAEHIRDLHRDRKRLAELSSQAIQRARTTFNEENMSSNLVGLINDVMLHAHDHPAQRQEGMPEEEPATYRPSPRGYQRLPEGLRLWIRTQMHSNPRLAHWLLNR
ncbi:MAG: glycosyltransferase family 4 protein [Verrucomicrobia bacterium]|nr:glycosyltransferase family 4 protein [Verrucomicrobiota bacterium]